MFSLEKFYNIIDENLLSPLHINHMFFAKFGSTDPIDIQYCQHTRGNPNIKNTIFYDQEPIYNNIFANLWDPIKFDPAFDRSYWANHLEHRFNTTMNHFTPDFNAIANSEHSQEKNNLLKSVNAYDWYYFFHGFAALDWFGNIPYRQPITKYSKVFITFNNLYTKKRSYRLSLIAGLLNRGLDSQGYISMSQHDIVDKIRGEIFDTNSQLSKNERKMIFQTLLPNPPKLIIDTKDHHGALSANDVLETMCKGLWHLVTETVYYDNKLHLTEKIFKPIVAQRPFILIASPGNLAYLKSYGFQSFDRWIDESYDEIQDPAERIIAVLDQVEKLCRLNSQDLHTMYQEMTEVLEHNFNWLYSGGFKKIIVNELVDNFRRCLIKHNAGLNSDNISYIDHSRMDWTDIQRRLNY